MSHQGILKDHNQIDFEALQIITLEHIDSIILILIVMLLINQVMNSYKIVFNMVHIVLL